MKDTCKIRITDDTSPSDMDSFFYDMWSRNRSVHLLLDTTQCKRVSLTRILSMKSVLNKHRNNSKKYIEYTTILVKSRLVKTFTGRSIYSKIRTTCIYRNTLIKMLYYIKW